MIIPSTVGITPSYYEAGKKERVGTARDIWTVFLRKMQARLWYSF